MKEVDMNYTIEKVKHIIQNFSVSHSMNCSCSEFSIKGGQAIFEFDNCIMGVSYCSDNWSPYYLTSIEVRLLDYDVPNTHKSKDLVYFFYDDINDTINDLESKLSEAYSYASSFNKSQLSSHIDEICSLVGEWRLGLHPDDKKIDFIIKENKYMCVGTFAQYYILSEGSTTIRELPRYISWKGCS